MAYIKLQAPIIQISNGIIEALFLEGRVYDTSISEVQVTVRRDALSIPIIKKSPVKLDQRTGQLLFIAEFPEGHLQEVGIQCGQTIFCHAHSSLDEAIFDDVSGTIDCDFPLGGYFVSNEDPKDRKFLSECNSEDNGYICDPPGADREVYKIGIAQYGVLRKDFFFDVDRPSTQTLEIGSYKIKHYQNGPAESATAYIVDFALLMHYEQRWRFDQVVIGDLASTMALGPGEKVTLSIRNTDSKKYSRKEETAEETIDKRDVEVGEKDIFSIASKIAETEGQSAKGGIGIKAGPVDFSFSGNVESSVARSTSSTMQHITNSTEKAANELKISQKLEVTEESEIASERGSTRELRNPLPDRPLWLKFFEQRKRYSVSTALVDWQHVLRIQISDFPFDRSFIFENRNFLTENLVDTSLRESLRKYFETVDQDTNAIYPSRKQREEAINIAEIALHYLFNYPPNIFNMGPSPMSRGNYPPDFTNNPAVGFDGSMPYSALTDARSKGWGKAVTILAVYHKLYQALKSDTDAVEQGLEPEKFRNNLSEEFLLDMVLSMEASLRPEWDGQEAENNLWDAILDNDDLTEVLRRLSSFLSLVGGVLRPKLQELRSEEEEPSALSESVIHQILQHIDSFKAYYSSRYVDYLWEKGLRVEFARMIEKFMKDFQDDPLYDQLDTSQLFVDDGYIVVPLSRDNSNDLFELEPELIDAINNTDIPRCVDLPCEGAYIVSQSGLCEQLVLPEIRPIDAAASISIDRR